MKFISVNKLLFIVTVALSTLAPQVKAEGNENLAMLMRGMMKDQTIVTAPLKAANLADVTEDMLRDAVLRTRTLRYFVKSFVDGFGTIQDGNLSVGEYTPVSILKLSGATQLDAVTKATELLNQLGSKYSSIEMAYRAELPKATAERDFSAVKTAMTEIQALMKEGHTLFK